MKSGLAVSPTPLAHILGLGFGVAVIFGGTVGVGILRLPGTIAGQLRSFWPIMLVWVAGGCYALLGAVSVAELGAAMPQGRRLLCVREARLWRRRGIRCGMGGLA